MKHRQCRTRCSEASWDKNMRHQQQEQTGKSFKPTGKEAKAQAMLVNPSGAWKAWINRLMVLLEDEATGYASNRIIQILKVQEMFAALLSAWYSQIKFRMVADHNKSFWAWVIG